MNMPKSLCDGYRHFRENRFITEEARYQELAEQQTPEVMIIGCADSRVDPATIFSAAPGQLFVVRNIAALVPPYEEQGTFHGTSAAVEFAVTTLKVKHIVVMGHGLCGGIAASLAVARHAPVGRFIEPWVELIGKQRDALVERIPASEPQRRQRELERVAIKTSLANLTTFNFVADAIENDGLALHGAWFSIAEAELEWLNPSTGLFERIEPHPA